MEGYPFNSIEAKWRQRWDEEKTHCVDLDQPGKKKYVLVMFSYPSEKKLHIGHWWNYSGTDIYARAMKMRGFNVFEPMGFDAFGLPAENFAIKHGVHPAVISRESIGLIREQLKQIGAMYDWDKEVITSTPEYYKWTQWLFLQLFKHDAAYLQNAPVNWCPKCMTVLANEQVKGDGSCDRCDTLVQNKDMKQWFFRITDFADDLLDGLDKIDWPESTKSMQRHWIGRSEGSEIQFKVEDSEEVIKTFTTRADTLFGVTYVVLAPEHKLVDKITSDKSRAEVDSYVLQARAQSDIDRLATDHEKTGVFTGAYAVNPVDGSRLPVWVADYVLGSYGTGAVMAVPAHDQRDYKFAEKYNLPLKWVIALPRKLIIAAEDRAEVAGTAKALEDYGVMHNSGQFDGLSSAEGKTAVTAWLDEQKVGKATVSYRLRDWSVSRQRYWGAPIPIIHCPKCGLVPVPEDQLPVVLPEEIEDFKPKGSSPLGAIDSFINVECPKCHGQAKRDPDTMDTFVDSSWYFLRYLSKDCDDYAFSKERLKDWMPIDVYIGGPEHATGHLIYARYITKFLHSIGELDFDEPAQKMVHQGIITFNGMRMSKSKGNVVNPDQFVDKYGADCFRLYLMFMGDFTAGGDWNDDGIIGIRRFQNRVWRLFEDWVIDKPVPGADDELVENADVKRVLHNSIKQITGNLESFQFNTAISRLMELVNSLYYYIGEKADVNLPFLRSTLEKLALLLAPLAPHICEELWEQLGHSESIFTQEWPTWDEEALIEAVITIAVQIKGKLVTTIDVPRGANQKTVVKKAMMEQKVQNRIEGKTIRKEIFVQDRILNIVV